MGFKILPACFVVLLLSSTINGSAYQEVQEIKNRKIVGQATNIITAKLLKGGIDNSKNSVFSPIGFASILAILGEGASDETYHDIATLLKHPNERTEVRSAYRSVLKHLQGLEPNKTPQFRSWFYIYKNSSVNESFRKLLTDDYFVTVRDVEPYNPDEFQSNPSTERTLNERETLVDLMDVQLKNAVQPIVNNSKDIVELDAFKHESGPVDETRIDNQKDASKFDEVVEDRQYIDSEKVATLDKNGQETIISIPHRTEQMEIMQAQERRIGKAFADKNEDGVSIISGNSIIAEKEDASENDTDKFEPKMLLFNGMYYRGSWAFPFQHLRVDNLFYTNVEPFPIKMMKACGYFRYAKCEKYNSEAIEFPYDNERYSMLVIFPDSRDGLRNLINNISSTSLSEITGQLEEALIEVSLPKFEVETTSGAEKMLAKEGLAPLFTSKADFSRISTAHKLRVGELQQHVTLRVDEGSSTENFLTATNLQLRSNAKIERTVTVDRPFLFFVRDCIDDVIILAGKITSLDAFEIHEPEIPKN